MRIWPFLLCCTAIWALPRNPSVASGNAHFLKQENGLQIRAENRTILTWDDFSIKAHEWAHFDLPSQQSVVLNRVLSDIPSSLLGTFTSNGQVFLVNPNGILVGKEARIDLASLIATTLDISNAAFLAKGALIFKGNPSEATVQNLGSIKAFDGDVLLIGWNVDNQGSIEAPNGLAAAIAAGHVMIRPEGQERIYIKPRSISENAYSSAFIHEATEDALSIQEFEGQVLLKGSIRAKDVLVLGDFIDATELAIDAPGGTVYIGGGDKGQNANYSNAKEIFLDESVIFNADGEKNGGRVVIWSDESTHSLAHISARGGPDEGDGGVVEISSKGILDFSWDIDVSAPNGKAGQLLLDPTDIVIRAVGPFTPVTFAVPSTWAGGTQPVFIDSGALATFLATMGSVTLSATSNLPDPGATGTITLNAGSDIVWMASNHLVLDAASTITINSNIQNSVGTGNVTLTTTTGMVLINTTGNTQAVSVGSQNGITTVVAPAGLTVQGAIGAARCAQVGYYAAPGDTCTGPIAVTCGPLNLLGATAVTGSSAQIGHGRINAGGAITLTTTPSLQHPLQPLQS